MKPIRVLFDNQIFQLQRQGGISRYFTELIKTFNRDPELGIQPVLSQSKFWNKHLVNESGYSGLGLATSRFKALASLVLGHWLQRKLEKSVDIVHVTFYLPGFYPSKGNAPVVATLYDMIPELHPQKGRLWNPHFSKKSYLTKADMVLAISESAANDMRNVLGIEKRAGITYLGVGPEFKSGLEAPSMASPLYYMFVGNRSGYKDVLTAFKAFAKFAVKNPEVRLLLVGGGPLNMTEIATMRNLGISDRVDQRDVSSAELPNYYSNALALLYPTNYEGFGLPLVEAMASQIPVLCSETSINREICQNAGNYFEVSDYESLFGLMESVSSDPKKFKDRIEIGKSRADSFSWQRCAEATANFYKELLGNNRRGA